jgi:prepilin-type N-terminal cleavage/methylation domain-containing protein
VHADSGQTKAAGFTLLEILVAMTILGIIMMTVYGTLSRTLYAKGYAEDRAELYAAGREAVLKIADELERALPPAPRSDVTFRGFDRGDRTPEDAIQFTIRTHSGLRAAVPRSGRATIVYSLAPLEGNDKLFVPLRQEYPMLTARNDLEADEEANEPEEPEPSSTYLIDPSDCSEQRFCVIGLSFHYLDPATGEWLELWDSTDEQEPKRFNKLPAAAEVTLSVLDSTGGTHDFSTIADLVLAPSTQPTPTPGRRTGPVHSQ